MTQFMVRKEVNNELITASYQLSEERIAQVMPVSNKLMTNLKKKVLYGHKLASCSVTNLFKVNKKDFGAAKKIVAQQVFLEDMNYNFKNSFSKIFKAPEIRIHNSYNTRY